MYQPEEIKNVTRKMIKLFDYPVSILAKESGLSRPTVSKFFNRKEIRPSSVELLFDLCIELIEAKENKRINNLRKEKQFTESFKMQRQVELNL